MFICLHCVHEHYTRFAHYQLWWAAEQMHVKSPRFPLINLSIELSILWDDLIAWQLSWMITCRLRNSYYTVGFCNKITARSFKEWKFLLADNNWLWRLQVTTMWFISMSWHCPCSWWTQWVRCEPASSRAFAFFKVENSLFSPWSQCITDLAKHYRR